MNKYKKFAPVVLRYGLAFVFLWFGGSQLRDQAMWTSYIPDWATNLSGQSVSTLVLINGLFEIIASVFLLMGFKVRIMASLLFLHLLTIVFELGFTSIGVRDIGLSVAALSVALHGGDMYSYDRE